MPLNSFIYNQCIIFSEIIMHLQIIWWSCYNPHTFQSELFMWSRNPCFQLDLGLSERNIWILYIVFFHKHKRAFNHSDYSEFQTSVFGDTRSLLDKEGHFNVSVWYVFYESLKLYKTEILIILASYDMIRLPWSYVIPHNAGLFILPQPFCVTAAI